MKKIVLATVASSALMAAAPSVAHAADATWVGGTPAPAGSDYGAAANWTPAGPPDGTASFGASANTNVVAAATFAVGGWTFNPGAAAYTFTINIGGGEIDFNGAGIVINGGSATITNKGLLQFFNTSTAGNAAITNTNTGDLRFFNTSTAGSATITNNFMLSFNDKSTAGSATIITNNNSLLQFLDTSTAGSATITNNGDLQFFKTSTAGNAAITNNNFLQFLDTSTAGKAVITNADPFAATDFSATTGPNRDGRLSAGSIAGSGNFFLGANQLTVGGNNLSSTVSGVISDCGANGNNCELPGPSGGSLVKIGTGTLTLSGVNTYTGATTVDEGTLAVNGSIAASSLTSVNANATLTGAGTVGATQINAGGTFAPGNGTPGSSMTVAGNLAFQSGAQYLVQLNAATSSFATVTGTAALAGTVRVASLSNSFAFNHSYTILTAGGLNGTRFDGFSAATGISGSLAYSGTAVTLNLTSSLGRIAGLNANQRAVGTALDTAFNTAGVATGGLGAIFAGNVAQNLTQASGETATGSQQTTFNAMTQFMGVMTDPLLGGRGDGALPGSGAASFAEQGNASASDGRKRAGSERDAYGMITKAVPRNPLFDPRWSVWAAGFGGSQTTDGNAALGSNATTSRLGATAVGADYWFSPNTIAGFALAGGATQFSVANGGSGRSDLFQAGAFIRHSVGAAYVSAAAAYGWQDITTDRTLTIAGIDRLRAAFNANAWSGRVEGGYRFATSWLGGIGLTPYAAGQFTTFDLPAYAERVVGGANTFALAYGAKSVTASRSELGLRSDKSWAMPDSVFTLRGRAAWAHDYNADRSAAATFQTLPGASFVVNGAAPAHDSALTTASAEIKWRNGVSLSATFEGEFSDVTRSYAGKGVARYAW